METDTTNYNSQSKLLKDFIKNVYEPAKSKSRCHFDGAPVTDRRLNFNVSYTLVVECLGNTCSAYDISIGFRMKLEKYESIKKEILFFLLQNSFNMFKKDPDYRCLYIHLTKNLLQKFSKEMFDALEIKYLFSYMGNHNETVYAFVKLVDNEDEKDGSTSNDDDDEDDDDEYW